MKFLKTNSINIFIIAILATGALLRANWYGDLRLSVAYKETISYIRGSKAPLFSWEIFAGPRLFTTNLLFKAAQASDVSTCPLIAYGAPAYGQEAYRANQSCFNKIAVTQNILAIVGWCFLAWSVSKSLQSPVIKIIAAISILVFGFTPQIAEWDSLLSPESLTLSLFSITLTLAIEIAFRISRSDTPFKSKLEKGLITAWTIIFLLWIFVRDVHLYAIPLTLGLIAILFFIKKYRTSKYLLLNFVLLFIFFLIGFLSAKDSLRATHYPLINALDEYIWPHPARIEFFQKYNMPERTSNLYQEWADANAANAYGAFLITHPGFIATTLWENLEQLNSDFVQPFFFAPEVKNREVLLSIGEMFHPETSSFYVIDLFILLALIAQAIELRTPTALSWAWLAIWFFAIASVTLLISFFGDTIGLRRHIMPSVEMLRLFLWVFIMPLFDTPQKSAEIKS